ncbi:MAG: hypothetical protein F9K16_02580 [Thermoanaerobaculia bacterium]|nr:MAG: hypothetical protein F9K16_02580 [Thermoanaerobaculia bacterium]MBZ0100756.1 hypothetical protein [Thermoanaerobaculia bacterium]
MRQLRLKKDLEAVASGVDAYLAAELPQARQSKIIDAVRLASDLLESAGRPRRTLVIYSDMIEESEELNFFRHVPTTEETQRFLEQQRVAGRLPRLDGVHVLVAGAGAGLYAAKLPSAQLDAVRAFWTAYFAACGAELRAGDYLPTAVRLDD